MPDTNSGTYRHVRALDRGLALLVALNTSGRSDPAELARIADIDRTTAYRLLNTLERLGYVAKSPSDGRYVLTPSVRDLSEGLTETDRTARIVCEELFAMLSEVMWPSDFATFEGGWMVIRETTHRFSPYSVHRAMVGRKRPLLETAMGRAVLAGASAQHRDEMVNMALRHGTILDDPQLAWERVERLLADYAERGYAWAIGGADRRISAIALPLQGSVSVIGSINVLFFSSAMTIEQAADKYLGPLSARASRIEERLLAYRLVELD
jgi:IclR family mhp operon transcriptional activator